MSDKILIEIVENSLSLDNSATRIYQQLAQNAETLDLKQFWQNIAQENEEHAVYWNKLITWAGQGSLSKVFSNPQKVLKEIELMQEKTEKLIKQCENVSDIKKAFALAFKLEFYLLNPAFETLLQYFNVFLNEKPLITHYDRHISKLFDSLYEYDLVTLELELLGETIHRLWQENRKMAIQNNYDPLTGILNRRGLFNAIEHLAHLAQRNANTVGIMMVDIDHFKNLNDSFGHQFGDGVLKYVATAINKTIRASDVLGRYGGEEFLVFLSAVQPEALYDVGEKIRLAVAAKNSDMGNVTISIGISFGKIKIKDNVNEAVKTLTRKADENLYHAKITGRNKVAI